MKITNTRLREIIREEASKLKSTRRLNESIDLKSMQKVIDFYGKYTEITGDKIVIDCSKLEDIFSLGGSSTRIDGKYIEIINPRKFNNSIELENIDNVDSITGLDKLSTPRLYLKGIETSIKLNADRILLDGGNVLRSTYPNIKYCDILFSISDKDISADFKSLKSMPNLQSLSIVVTRNIDSSLLRYIPSKISTLRLKDYTKIDLSELRAPIRTLILYSKSDYTGIYGLDDIRSTYGSLSDTIKRGIKSIVITSNPTTMDGDSYTIQEFESFLDKVGSKSNTDDYDFDGGDHALGIFDGTAYKKSAVKFSTELYNYMKDYPADENDDEDQLFEVVSLLKELVDICKKFDMKAGKKLSVPKVFDKTMYAELYDIIDVIQITDTRELKSNEDPYEHRAPAIQDLEQLVRSLNSKLKSK